MTRSSSCLPGICSDKNPLHNPYNLRQHPFRDADWTFPTRTPTGTEVNCEKGPIYPLMSDSSLVTPERASRECWPCGEFRDVGTPTPPTCVNHTARPTVGRVSLPLAGFEAQRGRVDDIYPAAVVRRVGGPHAAGERGG
eukprot:6287577-Pyramimonas_sp.AAC.1